MNILQNIILDKQKEVAQKKKFIPRETWEMLPGFAKKTRSLKKALLKQNSNGIIAEFKRKSPSSQYRNDISINDVLPVYEKYAAGISILTDEIYFGGTNDDLLIADNLVDIPLLRKDFIIDEYQLYESKGLGADVILLIAALHSPQQIKHLAKMARALNLEIILEIHDEKELGHICDEVDMVGVNNRNLNTFETDLENSFRLIHQIPKVKPSISESGITTGSELKALRHAGFRGFLIGSLFMKTNNPAQALEN
ncbi:MAG: indole-3-glycerol phosphate synthase TrpC, partial [Chitinophagaceae bacterium]